MEWPRVRLLEQFWYHRGAASHQHLIGHWWCHLCITDPNHTTSPVHRKSSWCFKLFIIQPPTERKAHDPKHATSVIHPSLTVTVLPIPYRRAIAVLSQHTQKGAFIPIKTRMADRCAFWPNGVMYWSVSDYREAHFIDHFQAGLMRPSSVKLKLPPLSALQTANFRWTHCTACSRYIFNSLIIVDTFQSTSLMLMLHSIYVAGL